MMNHFRALSALLLALLIAACGDSPSAPVVEPPPADQASLQVTVQGLPAGAPPALTVTGPNGFSRALTGSQTLTGLIPGVYTVNVQPVTLNGLEYGAERELRFVEVASAATTRVEVTYRAFNLRIEGAHITQAIQRFDGSIPLVAGRDGVLRVFVTANNTNTVSVPVRARFFRDGTLLATELIAAPSFATPTDVVEGSLSNSYNLRVPGALLQPGVSVLVDVDPERTVTEGTLEDNVFPASGEPAPLDVRVVPSLDLVLVPIQQGDGTVGNVTEANKDRYVADLARMFPIGEMRISVRDPYVTGTRLRPTEGWVPLLSELEAVRLGDGRSAQYYYGVATINYQHGIYGIAYRPGKTALGNDYLDDRNLNASMTLAHELGHSMNRLHSQCGAATGVDPNYPHAGGQIGSHGLDVGAMRIFGPGTRDLMGYCEDRWIGDHTYLEVLNHRLNAEATTGVSVRGAEPSLIVWGRIENGLVTLEPAFEAETARSLPSRSGPYMLEGLDADGRRLFALGFAGQPVEHAGPDDRIFAFALPATMAQPQRLATLRVIGPRQAVVSRSVARERREPMVRRGTHRGGERLEWNSEEHPLLVIRDPESGRIISLARDGVADLGRAAGPVEVMASDGVRSHPASIGVR